ncbi:MAG: hypothetical protein ACRD3B_04295 [Candidatus Sulfotelmatobacter sp.]
MSGKLMLAELLLSGFFAIACIRAHGPIPAGERLTFGEFFRFPDRLDRLKRSRWQWASMVALMLVLRLQQQLPLLLEILVAAEFLLFLSFPSRREVRSSGK